MSFLDKIMFWKKEEPLPPPKLDLPKYEKPPAMTPPPSLHPPGATEPPIHHEAPPAFQPPQPVHQAERPAALPSLQQHTEQSHDMQLISSKLDTIKAQLDTVIQRLDRLEQKERPYQQRWQ